MEIFIDIPEYENLYAVSNLGRVKSYPKQKGTAWKKETFLKPAIKRNGYGAVALCKNNEIKTVSIHRLVAICFIDNTENKKHVNHIDGNKLNNNTSNLEWNTPSENLKHSFKLGLSRQDGEYHTTKKLNWENVNEIRRSHKSGVSHIELANKFNIHPGHVKNIVAGLYWKIK